jgi:hypothetical protein
MTKRNSILASAGPSQNAAATEPHVADRGGQQSIEQWEREAGLAGPAAITTDENRTKKSGSAKNPATARSARTAADCSQKVSKTETALRLLRRKSGATLPELQETTGWQAHSVRGFLSATVKKKMGLNLSSEVGRQGIRRYRIITESDAG